MRYVIYGLVLLMVGCVRAPIQGRMDPYPAPQISFASPELANFTAVGIPNVERKNGILYVQVPIRSASDYDLHVDYRYTFFNAQGGIIHQSSWIGNTVLVKNAPSEIRFNSTTADAADWRMDLRYSR